MVQGNEEELKYVGKVRGRWDGGLCGAAYYPKTYLGDTWYHLDLFLHDFGRFLDLFCLILATINAIYQQVC